MVPNWVYFGQGKDFKLTTELSEKVQYFRNQAIKNGLNEAILLMPINEVLLFTFKTKLCVFRVKKMGGHRLRFGENMPGRTPKSE